MQLVVINPVEHRGHLEEHIDTRYKAFSREYSLGGLYISHLKVTLCRNVTLVSSVVVECPSRAQGVTALNGECPPQLPRA
jgi:hypothetical protein